MFHLNFVNESDAYFLVIYSQVFGPDSKYFPIGQETLFIKSVVHALVHFQSPMDVAI